MAKNSRPLSEFVGAWPTPVVTDSLGARNRTSGRTDPNSKHHDGVTLNDAIQMWSTPRASDCEGGPDLVRRDTGAPQSNLITQVALWSTPTVSVTTGGQMSRGQDRQDELLLNGQAQLVSSHLVPMTYPVGETRSHPRRSLNPLFVEWLMGWPAGWTLLAWTDFACSATALSHFKRRMRCALSQLASPPAPPAQTDLFG